MGRLNKKIIIVLILVIGIVIILSGLKSNYAFFGRINEYKNKFYGKTLNKDFSTKIKSGNLSTDYTIEQALSDIEELDLNTINIPVIVHIKDINSSEVTLDNQSKAKAIELIKKLRWKKINIILEAYPWIKNGEQYETQWKPEDMNQFFSSWRTKVLKDLIDEIAVPYHVDALNVASNLVNMEQNEEDWIETIAYVRQYYSGLVTYRTNWWYKNSDFEKKLNNRLFSKVDFISVAAYFELSDKDLNRTEELIKAMNSTTAQNRKQNIEEQLKKLHDKWQKPIFFGELGFPRRSGAAKEPWNPEPSKVENDVEQANCFEAYRRVFEYKDWNLGFSIFAIGERSEGKNYYPSERTEEVIKGWYK